MQLPDDLNIDLAWLRYKKDLSDRAFCDNPFEVEIIENNYDDWKKNLKAQLNNYSFSRSKVVDIPKKNYHLRPGTLLTPEDSTIYQALLLYDIKKIREALLWSAIEDRRFAYILREDQTKESWFTNEFKGWNRFRQKSLGYIDHGYKWVVFADISGCFENISLKRLSLDLRNLGVTENIVKSLSCCLNRWAEPKERGIPQGNRCSFILGEIYFDYIDKRLKYGDYTFCRYVDDFRIFCKSKGEAVKALHFLTQLVREKELNLQTAKSYILESQEAKKKLDKIAVIIREVEENLLIELSDIAQYDFGYSTPASIEIKIQMTEEDEVDLITIQRAFEKYIVADNSKFDKTFFHYCINRLGASKDSHAVDFCLEMVLERPEEFIHMLHYFSKLKERRLEIAEKLINIFKDADCLLERHYYLLLRWVYIEKLQSELILELCRKKGLNSCSDQYTKHYAWAILGENGDAADLDAIEAQYNDIQNELSRAIIISSIRKMIKERRNSIYNRAKDDGILVQYAINRFK